MVVRPTGGKSRSAGSKRGAQLSRHLREIFGFGALQCQRPLAHYCHAQRVVRHLNEKVEAVRHALERIHILGESLPVEAHTLGKRYSGNILNPFHQGNQIVNGAIALTRMERSKTDAAIAEHRGGNAVMDARTEGLVPARLTVVMSVDIDETRREPGSFGFDARAGFAPDTPDLGNASGADRQIGRVRRLAGAIDQRRRFDHKIMHRVIASTELTQSQRPDAKHPKGWRRAASRARAGSATR